MKKTVLTFGLIGGAIMVTMMFATMPFIDKIGFDKGEIIGYTTMILAFMLLQQMQSFKAMYDNPFINAGITFLEPFPIGLIVTLISAAILRKKTVAATSDEGRAAQLQVQ
jgi:hypothetical protein